MPGNQKALVLRWFEEVWNQERRETIDEMMSPTLILHDESSTTTGPESFKQFYDQMRSDFSHVRVKTHEFVSSGDLACVRWTSTMTHRANGKELSVSGMSMFRFADGQFVEAWQSWDKFGLMEQMGATSAKAMYVASAGSH
jgi:predicted SnoaL-like aldol condensation-catalyzing enzyme